MEKYGNCVSDGGAGRGFLQALSEREAVAGLNTDYSSESHRRPSWVAVFSYLATDTRHLYLTLLDQKKEKKDKSSPLKCPNSNAECFCLAGYTITV